MCTTWSGSIDSSVGTASPEYDSAAYGSSSSRSRPACFAIFASSWRRASGMRRPVGFWKFGSTYRKRAPSSSFGVSAAGTRPSSSDVHGDELRLEQRERLQRAEIGRRFHQHAAARVDQRLAEQVEALLRARGHEHVLRIDAHRPRRVARRNPFAQLQIAFRRAVLQRRRRRVGQHCPPLSRAGARPETCRAKAGRRRTK